MSAAVCCSLSADCLCVLAGMSYVSCVVYVICCRLLLRGVWCTRLLLLCVVCNVCWGVVDVCRLWFAVCCSLCLVVCVSAAVLWLVLVVCWLLRVAACRFDVSCDVPFVVWCLCLLFVPKRC